MRLQKGSGKGFPFGNMLVIFYSLLLEKQNFNGIIYVKANVYIILIGEYYG